ncbi:jasmonate-induced protein homolog [Silene latifolia]|uniref:jasmonate-induced protein homolog n=1 Tax=Silene latifolia TaxID=37657 RepID=UPI003D78864D
MASIQVQKGACSSETGIQMEYGTRATMSNKTPSSLMKLDRCINWFGNPSTIEYPDNIPQNASSRFLHVKDSESGSMGAVQYSGPNAAGDPCAWILAWKAPIDNTTPESPNRVYATCGSKESMDLINWDEIRLNLEKALTTCEAEDSGSKTRVDAKIVDPVPNSAIVNANFGFMI